MLSAIKEYLKCMDKLLLVLAVIASAGGMVLIYSATYSYNDDRYIRTQLIAVIIGIVVYLIVSAFNMEKLSRLWRLWALLNMAFIGSLYFFGVGESNRSWIRFAGIGIQPAEIGKLVFIVTFSRDMVECRKRGFTVRGSVELLVHALLTAAFVIVFSKDDGMMVAFIVIAVVIAFAAGIKLKWFLVGGAVTVSLMPLAWNYALDKYQKLRILAVFNPELYPDTAYQASQCKKAMSNGGLTGMGFLQGTQTQLGLIPTKHTDSIIAIAGEEFGLIGCLAVIILLSFIIARCVASALGSSSATEALIATGVAGMLAFQTILNIGMNIGVLPVVGLTLPFFSYGGSSIVTMFAALGMVSAVRRAEKARNI